MVTLHYIMLRYVHNNELKLYMIPMYFVTIILSYVVILFIL